MLAGTFSLKTTKMYWLRNNFLIAYIFAQNGENFPTGNWQFPAVTFSSKIAEMYQLGINHSQPVQFRPKLQKCIVQLTILCRYIFCQN